MRRAGSISQGGMIAEDVVNDLAEQRGKDSPSQRMAWRGALGRLASAGVNVTFLNRVAKEAPHPRCVNRLADLIARAGLDGTGALMTAVDGSDHNLREWLAALEIFYQYIERQGQQPQLKEALGYLSCCDEAESELSLGGCVAMMLEEHGFVGRDE